MYCVSAATFSFKAETSSELRSSLRVEFRSALLLLFTNRSRGLFLLLFQFHLGTSLNAALSTWLCGGPEETQLKLGTRQNSLSRLDCLYIIPMCSYWGASWALKELSSSTATMSDAVCRRVNHNVPQTIFRTWNDHQREGNYWKVTFSLLESKMDWNDPMGKLSPNSKFMSSKFIIKNVTFFVDVIAVLVLLLNCDLK